VTGDAQIPALYIHSFNTADATGSGTITINALQRVLTTSSLPAADIDKVGSYSSILYTLVRFYYASFPNPAPIMLACICPLAVLCHKLLASYVYDLTDMITDHLASICRLSIL
jgi:hypothetical protein